MDLAVTHIPRRPTALIVNDDPSQQRLIGAVLEKVGVVTRICSGAEDALVSLAADADVDLIVTDLHMPGIDGWRFCQLLRSPDYAPFNSVPILVVSATFSGRDAEQVSLDLGANAFLAAPFAPSALQDYARALLSGRRPEIAPQALIVHADASEAQRLRAAFAGAGFSVDCAASGADALASCRILLPDVVVIDDQLPDRPAALLLAELKPPGSRTVALAITNGPQACEGLSLARHGADATVPGPADAMRLIGLAQTARRQRALLRVEELLKQRSNALRESEGRWRSLFEAIPEIVVVHDDEGVIRHVNQTGADHLGYPAHELIGRNLGEFELHAAANAGADGDGGPGDGVETVWRARNGTAIPVEVIQRRLHFDGSAAVLSVARDVTVRRDLARQRQNFLAMLTHDIKNPLAIVLGFAELLGEVGDLNAEQRDMVGRMQANATTVLGLVANYLNLTQIESGGLALQRRPVLLRELLAATLVPYAGRAAQEGLQLDAVFAADLDVIEADPLALERVFTNLVHNAIKFTPAGGRIAVEAERDGGGVTVRVRDSGSGIAATELATIFQPYRRGTMRQPREGVGLGLYIAESLVQAHGGHIAVASQLGAGTVFSVWLPTGADASAAR